MTLIKAWINNIFKINQAMDKIYKSDSQALNSIEKKVEYFSVTS